MSGSRKKPTPAPDPKPPLRVVERRRFGKQLEHQARRGKDLRKLAPIISTLIARQPLEPKYQDHALTGDWTGCRECHVEPDWLLIYEADDDEIRFLATGSHSDLFG